MAEVRGESHSVLLKWCSHGQSKTTTLKQENAGGVYCRYGSITKRLPNAKDFGPGEYSKGNNVKVLEVVGLMFYK